MYQLILVPGDDKALGSWGGVTFNNFTHAHLVGYVTFENVPHTVASGR